MVDKEVPLLAGGMLVDPVLLEERPVRPCARGECRSECCGEGVWVFLSEKQAILLHAAAIAPHLAPERRDPAAWFDGLAEPETDHPAGGTTDGTAVIPDPAHPSRESCVFLRPDARCGLQVAAIEDGDHPWRYKPYWCILHPLVFDRHVLTMADDSSVARAGGHCSRPDPESVRPLYRTYEPEARLALGDAGFDELDALAGRRRAE